MIVRHNSDLQPIETPGGNLATSLATPSSGASEVSVIRQVMVPGNQNPPHRHDREEVMMLSSGQVTVTAGDQSVTLTSGDLVIIPAEMLHSVANTGSEPAEWVIISPRGVRFFNSDGEEVHPGWAQ